MTFPKEPKVSYACRSLISKILVPQRVRVKIEIIKEDGWLVMPALSPRKSFDILITDDEAQKINSENERNEMLVNRMVAFDEQMNGGQINH